MPDLLPEELQYLLQPWLLWLLRRQLGIEWWNAVPDGLLEQKIVDT
jgi:hypothetical protein